MSKLIKSPTVLIVDDDESFHDRVSKYLADYRLLHAYNGRHTGEMLSRHHVDVVLLDLNLPDTTGLALLDEIRARSDDIEIIVITAHLDLPTAVIAVKKGAFDFLTKTWENYRQLGDHIERALRNRRRRREQIDARVPPWLRDAFELLEDTAASSLRQVVKLARQIADTPVTALIEGESGVGKEVLARYIHVHSRRFDNAFIPVHLAAVPETLLESQLFGHVKGSFTGAVRDRIGKFEMADGGTLFLDEIGELDGGAQVKLLRVLQEREVERIGAPEPSPVDVRVIAATNKSLFDEVQAGRFREDLFYRLNVVRLELPPLRKRKGDLPALVELMADKHAAIMGREAPTFTEDAMRVLRDYDWPGNIRELENLVMRLVAINPGKAITTDDIPPEYCLANLNSLAARAVNSRPDDLREERLYFLAREQFERYLVRLMVNRCSGDKRAAARALGVSYSTVKEKTRGSAESLSIEL